jgi:outer membrane immunogenic protein
MKKFLLGAIGLAALGGLAAVGMTAPASAADLGAAPYSKAPAPMMAAIYDWSGFYIGANGGWGSSRKCWDNTTLAGVFNAAEGCHNATGAVAGGQVGYRLQSSSWVFGIEAQGDWANLRGSNASLIVPGSVLIGNALVALPAITNRSRIDAFGLFTGQVGYAFNTALFYVKGGAAVTADRFDQWTTAGNVLVSNGTADNRWGGTVGTGVEFAFAPNWSAAVEYDHLFMGSKLTTFTTPLGVVFGTDRIRQDVDLVTVRVNYRWGGPVVAKY